MTLCTYCGEDKKLSREHIYSNGILRIFDDVAPISIDNERGIAHKADPIIRDICIDCNNSLSDCDSEMIKFTEAHLQETLKPGTSISLDRTNVLRWVVKTAANIARSNSNPPNWWKGYIPFIIGNTDTLPEADCYFSPWADLSPMGFASVIGAVHSIYGIDAILIGFSAGHSKHISDQLKLAFTIKVGYGVFLLLIWKPDCIDRDTVNSDLESYGWRKIERLKNIMKMAYGDMSSTNFNVICDPNKNIQELLRADQRARGC